MVDLVGIGLARGIDNTEIIDFTYPQKAQKCLVCRIGCTIFVR